MAKGNYKKTKTKQQKKDTKFSFETSIVNKREIISNMIKIGQQLFDKYINIGSEFEINIPS